VPRAAIRLDRAALRTIDSVDHLAAHYAGVPVLLVSQPFHLPRLLFLAQCRGVVAWGLDAPGPRPGLRTRLREDFACLRALADVGIARRSPPASDVDPG